MQTDAARRNPGISGRGGCSDPDPVRDSTIASIHAHNAAHGCFLARVERN
jgi:hypothetical protein